MTGGAVSRGKDAWLGTPSVFFPLATPEALPPVIIGGGADLAFLSRICAQSEEPTTVKSDLAID